MKNNSTKAIKFFRNKDRAKTLIASEIARRHGIIHGARSLNAHFPPYLDRPTEDFDVFSPNPKKSAHIVEKQLDKAFGGNFFRVKKGSNPKVETYKVVSNVDNMSVADFTRPMRRIPNVAKGRQMFTTLKYQEEQSKRVLIREINRNYGHRKF